MKINQYNQMMSYLSDSFNPALLRSQVATLEQREGFATGGTYKDYVSRGEEYKDLTFEEWLQEDKPGYKPSEFGRVDKAIGGRVNFQYGGPAYLESVFKEALESNNYDIDDIFKKAAAKKTELYNQTKLGTYKVPLSKEKAETMFRKYVSYERSMSPEDYMSYIQERIKNPNTPHIEGWNQPLKGTPLEAKGIGTTKNVPVPNLKKAEKMLSPQELKQWRAYTNKQQKKVKYQRTFQKSEKFNPETGQFEYDPKIKQEALSKKYLRKNIRRAIKADAYKQLSASEKAKYLDFEKRLDTIGNIIKENPNYILEDTEVMNKLSTAVDPKTGEIYKKSPSFTDIKNRRIWEVEHIDPVVQGQTKGRGSFLRNLQVLPESIHKNFKNNAETFLNNHYEDKKYQSQVDNIINKANELKVELRVKGVGKVGYKPTFTNFADKAEDVISTYVKNPEARKAYTNITGNILKPEVAPGETGSISTDLLKDIGKGVGTVAKPVLKTIGSLPVAGTYAGMTIKENLDEGKNIVDATVDPLVGVELLLPETVKRLGPLMAKAARLSTPVGTVLTGLGTLKERTQDMLKEADRLTATPYQEDLLEDYAAKQYRGYQLGGRVGFADGPDDPNKRSTMKILGGLASLPLVGRFFDLAQIAAPVAEKAVSTAQNVPSYFFKLINKIKKFGKDETEIFSREPREQVTTYRTSDADYELYEDLNTGSVQIKIRKGDPDGYSGYKEQELTLTKNQPDERTGVVSSDYDEYTVRPDTDGKMKDIDEGLEDIDDLIEELGPENISVKELEDMGYDVNRLGPTIKKKLGIK
jgi:hypothetical protein